MESIFQLRSQNFDKESGRLRNLPRAAWSPAKTSNWQKWSKYNITDGKKLYKSASYHVQFELDSEKFQLSRHNI